MDTNQPPILELISELQKSGARGLRRYCTWIDRYRKDISDYYPKSCDDNFLTFTHQLCDDKRWELAAIAKTLNVLRYLPMGPLSPSARHGTDIPNSELDQFARMAIEKLTHCNEYIEFRLSRPIF